MLGEQSDIRFEHPIDPMEAHHFDATTDFLKTQRGRQHSDAVIAAARLVLVDGVDPAEVRMREEFRETVSQSNLWKVLKRYPKAFDEMVKKSGNKFVSGIFPPALAEVLQLVDAKETEKLVQLLNSSKQKK